jgi:two-component system response regulator YesN
MMAKRSGRSPNYFCQLFKKEIGVSFVEYLNSVRIEKAKELLDNTDSMEYEIAVRVGYKEGKYFSVIFKKMTGMSPRQYRNRVSKDADRKKGQQIPGRTLWKKN